MCIRCSLKNFQIVQKKTISGNVFENRLKITETTTAFQHRVMQQQFMRTTMESQSFLKTRLDLAATVFCSLTDGFGPWPGTGREVSWSCKSCTWSMQKCDVSSPISTNCLTAFARPGQLHVSTVATQVYFCGMLPQRRWTNFEQDRFLSEQSSYRRNCLVINRSLWTELPS